MFRWGRLLLDKWFRGIPRSLGHSCLCGSFGVTRRSWHQSNHVVPSLSDANGRDLLCKFLSFKCKAHLQPFQYLNVVISNLAEGVGASRKIFEYIQREPEIKYDGVVEKKIDGRVEFDGVTFAYPTRANNVLVVSYYLSIWSSFPRFRWNKRLTKHFR
jgi:hypothetical protein